MSLGFFLFDNYRWAKALPGGEWGEPTLHPWEYQEQEVNVNSYVRKARQYHKNGGTGRKRIRGHKRKPTQQSLEERLFQAEPPDPFLPKAISYGIKNLYKYM